MRIGRAVATIALVGALAACGPFPTREAYFGQMNTWVGKPADLLAQTWGPPDKHWKMADGSTLMEYLRARSRYVPGSSFPDYDRVRVRGPDGRLQWTTVRTWRREPGYTVVDSCVTRFTVAPSGLIQSFVFDGNDCVAMPAGPA